MTKTKTTQKFEADYDNGPARKLKNVPADLVAAESLGILKLPRPIASALDSYVLGYTIWGPAAAARRAHTEKALEAATKEQRTRDAQAVSDLLAKGPDAFADLGSAIDSVDRVTDAEAAHESAKRTSVAIDAAVKGQLLYMNGLAGGDYRDAMLDVLDKAWFEYVEVSTLSSTTLGELARLESVSTEARALVGRLLLWVEGVNRGQGFSKGDMKLVHDAIRSEDWNRLPTLDRIKEATAQEATESPEAKAEEAADKAKAVKRAEDIRYAAEGARSRQGRLKSVTANAEAERGLHRQNSDEDTLVEVAT